MRQIRKLSRNRLSIIISIGILCISVAFMVQWKYVDGTSMSPTISNGMGLLVIRIPASLLRRGDIIVFQSSRAADNGSYQWIKRVIGMPEETVEIWGNRPAQPSYIKIYSHAYPAGFKIREPYIKGRRANFYEKKKFVLGKNEYFVVGDDRENSFDSRDIGPIPPRSIIGKIIIFPSWDNILCMF